MEAGPSILLVDDTDDIRILLRQALELDGYFRVVGDAADGRSALELAATLQPDLVMLDLAMPVMDGLEALPLLLECSPGSRVVVLSGFEQEALGAEAVRLGAAAYIQKGRPLRHIISVAHQVLGSAAPERVELHPPAAPADLVAVVAHELRGPLTTIRGASETLSGNWETLAPEQQLELVRMIQRQSGYMTRLVDDLLTVARLDGGTMALNPHLFDLATEVARMAATEHPDVRLSGGTAPAPVVADLHRMEQVVANLVSNAAHYGAPPIIVSVSTSSDAVVLTVRDHGPGVPRDRVDELFQRFSPLARGRKDANGLGLFIVRELVEAQGGTVSYRAAAPGAEFVVTLPRPNTAATGG